MKIRLPMLILCLAISSATASYYIISQTKINSQTSIMSAFKCTKKDSTSEISPKDSYITKNNVIQIQKSALVKICNNSSKVKRLIIHISPYSNQIVWPYINISTESGLLKSGYTKSDTRIKLTMKPDEAAYLSTHNQLYSLGRRISVDLLISEEK